MQPRMHQYYLLKLSTIVTFCKNTGTEVARSRGGRNMFSGGNEFQFEYIRLRAINHFIKRRFVLVHKNIYFDKTPVKLTSHRT